jgi:primosomal protein N' (replication factor Y) (superfamily II helicase)
MIGHIGLEGQGLKAYLITMSQCPTPLADVLLPLAVEGPYSYRVPDGMKLELGSYVEVPLASRSYIGVVWDLREAVGTNLKLRDVTERFDMPAMPALHRKFIDWLAAYYLEPLGNVLRMVLRVPSVFAPERQRMAYQIGPTQPAKLTAQRERVLEVARGGFAFSAAELAAAAGVGASVIKALVKTGALWPVPLPAHAAFQQPKLNPAKKTLSPAQKKAAAELRAVVAARQHKVMLLDGVTGSGKTEVYFEAMAAVLAAGAQVLLLLPEIALTGGFLARVEERFGAVPAGWHSDMRPRERERVWRGVAEGRARIVVGARSALFLPWKNLGLIVVDEEHENAYKQSEGVPYHARDMAVLYGTIGKFPVILSSATPSLESLVNVDRGRYGTVKLDDRHGRPELPELKLIDMRSEKLEAGSWLSPPMVAEVQKALASGEQALLFLNRRGFAPLTLCRACGFRLDCPHCAASLVEHRFRHLLMCHHCGHKEPMPKACPKCGTEEKMTPVGPGVERLAEEALRVFPEAKLALLSSDLTRGDTLREVLRDITSGTHNLIIGTQLVAKGHHFPHLTFVGVVDADLALESSDPRAGERTWSMLAQVAGRAGRGEKPGHALVQTYSPDHPLMQALAKGDRDAYLVQEKRIREQAALPPYGRLAAVVVSANDAMDAERFARSLAGMIPPTDDLEVLGPAQAPIAVIRGRHRFRFLVKAGRNKDLQGFLKQWLSHVKPKGSTALHIDVDPYNFL